MATTKVTLGYWDIRGLAESIRTFLEYLQIPYDQEKFTKYEDWVERKSKMNIRFVNLPFLIEEGKIVVESEAILARLSQIANKPDLAGKEQDRIEFIQIQGVVNDIIKGIDQCFYGGHKTEEEVKKKAEGFMGWRGASKFKDLDSLLSEREWALGYLTYLDFRLVEYLERLADLDRELGTKTVSDYPNLQAYIKRLYELPGVKEYRASSRFQARPHNFFMAAWK